MADILFGTFENVGGIPQVFSLRHIYFTAKSSYLVPSACFPMPSVMGFYILHELPAFIMYLGIRYLCQIYTDTYPVGKCFCPDVVLQVTGTVQDAPSARQVVFAFAFLPPGTGRAVLNKPLGGKIGIFHFLSCSCHIPRNLFLQPTDFIRLTA